MSVYDDNEEDFIYEELLEFIETKGSIRLLEIVLDVIRNTQGTQNRPQGEWTVVKSPLGNATLVKCPVCGDEFVGNCVEDFNFCPNCGADMLRRAIDN